MPRIKALWINGVIGKEFHDLMGVIREAKLQAMKVLGTKSVHVLYVQPIPQYEGFVALVMPGGSNPPVAGGGGETSPGHPEKGK